MEANTRFPHKIKIVKEVSDGNFPPIFSKVTLFESECRVFPSKSGGTGIESGAFVSDYKVSMPYDEVLISTGETVEVTDRVRSYKGTVVASYNGNLGANLWFNEVKN